MLSFVVSGVGSFGTHAHYYLVPVSVIIISISASLKIEWHIYSTPNLLSTNLDCGNYLTCFIYFIPGCSGT